MCQQEACSVTSVWGQALINIPEWGLCLQINQNASPRDGGLCGHPPSKSVFCCFPALWSSCGCGTRGHVSKELVAPKVKLGLKAQGRRTAVLSREVAKIKPSFRFGAALSVPAPSPSTHGPCARFPLRLQVQKADVPAGGLLGYKCVGAGLDKYSRMGFVPSN